MACKPSCTQPRTPNPPPRQISQVRVVSLEQVKLRRAREAMCTACEFRRLCRFGGQDPEATAARQDPAEICWAGYWPDERGIVHRGMFATIGVPKAIRLRLGLRAAWKVLRHQLAQDGSYPGCGCFLALFNAKERAARVIRRARRRLWRGLRRWARRSCLW